MPAKQQDAAAAAEVEGVLLDLFEAGQRGDVDAVRAGHADDLLLYKSGREKHRTDLLAAIEAVDWNGEIKPRIQYWLSDLVTRVDGDLATITYRNRAELKFPDGREDSPRWLENAILERTDRWRIVFLHSSYEVAD